MIYVKWKLERKLLTPLKYTDIEYLNPLFLQKDRGFCNLSKPLKVLYNDDNYDYRTEK